MLDLSDADSIDLHSNASIIEVLKEKEKDVGTNDLSDTDVYFDFMPKKVKNDTNPLFQATNLDLLRKEVKS